MSYYAEMLDLFIDLRGEGYPPEGFVIHIPDEASFEFNRKLLNPKGFDYETEDYHRNTFSLMYFSNEIGLGVYQGYGVLWSDKIISPEFHPIPRLTAMRLGEWKKKHAHWNTSEIKTKEWETIFYSPPIP